MTALCTWVPSKSLGTRNGADCLCRFGQQQPCTCTYLDVTLFESSVTNKQQEGTIGTLALHILCVAVCQAMS